PHVYPRPHTLHSFPTRRSSDLQTNKVPPGYKDSAKELGAAGDLIIWRTILEIGRTRKAHLVFVSGDEKADWWYRASGSVLYPRLDRKSTRLNSSHEWISYAVFC